MRRLQAFWAVAAATASALFLQACAVQDIVRENSGGGGCDGARASLVYVIEGDGHMAYHDASGNEHDAAEEKYQEAVAVAEHLHHGEVIILRSDAPAFFLLPSGDGEILHYCKGILSGRGQYRRDEGQSDFEIAALVTASHGTENRSVRRILVYYGHSLKGAAPIIGPGDVNEHATVAGLGRALQKLTENGKDSLDLLILSACQTAGEEILRTAKPYVRVLLSSPEDLHLSLMDTDALELVEGNPQIPTLTLADSIASRAFRNLVDRTRTVVTVARFDLATLQRLPAPSSYLDSLTPPDGVRLWYRPPQFGKRTKTAEQ